MGEQELFLMSDERAKVPHLSTSSRVCFRNMFINTIVFDILWCKCMMTIGCVLG